MRTKVKEILDVSAVHDVNEENHDLHNFRSRSHRRCSQTCRRVEDPRTCSVEDFGEKKITFMAKKGNFRPADVTEAPVL